MEAEARGSWEPLPGEAADLITIAEAKDKFLTEAESGRRLGESTLKKYKLMLRHLEEFASKKGFVYLKQLNTDTLRDFRDSWHLGPRTALKKLERVKAFFRFAVENNWIPANPARVVRGPVNVRERHKLPFEPAEMQRIIEAYDHVRVQYFSNKEVLAFILLLRYSGLRIGDAAMLTTDRFKGDDLYLYTQKSGNHVYVPLPPIVGEHDSEYQPAPWQILIHGSQIASYGNGRRPLAQETRTRIHSGKSSRRAPASVPAHVRG